MHYDIVHPGSFTPDALPAIMSTLETFEHLGADLDLPGVHAAREHFGNWQAITARHKDIQADAGPALSKAAKALAAGDLPDEELYAVVATIESASKPGSALGRVFKEAALEAARNTHRALGRRRRRLH